MYIVRPVTPPERRGETPNKSAQMRQVMVGQFPLSFNLLTGEFALAGSRLTVKEWISLREDVDRFLEKYHMLEILEVHDYRPSMTKLAVGAVGWLTRR